MKFSKAELAGLCVTAGALCALAGWSARSWVGADSYRVSGEHLPTAPTAAAQVFLPDEPVDLNTATLAQLMGLPGIGQTRAQAILDYRETEGSFTCPEDVMQVPGIGQATYEALADYITAASP